MAYPIESPRARYQQVADDLRAAIQDHEYEVGSALPSQPELARRYALNQTTISRAIGVLRGEGLVRVERGRVAVVVGDRVRHCPTCTCHQS